MASYLHLADVPELDKSYSNVANFSSEGSKQTWFIERRKGIITVNSFIPDLFRTHFTLPIPLDDVQYRACNYCFYQMPTGKWAYYFIDEWEYLTSSSCKIHVSLDVWTTYCLDIELNHSFIDRCHVDRFTSAGLPTREVVDEGFNFNDYSQVSKVKVCEYVNSFIMTSTEPLGYIPKSQGGSNELTRGVITKEGFRFIKGYEAFTPTGLYLSGESFRTVGYGSTEKYNLSYYNLHQPFPCTEQRASEIFAERITNEFGTRIYEALDEAGVQFKITKSMFDAMCSLAYNRGINGFLNDSTSPFQTIKQDPFAFELIREKWVNYAVTSNGQVLQGLVSRRKAEANIYCFGDYEMRSIGIYKDNGSGVGVLSGTVTDNNGNGYIPPHLPNKNESIDANKNQIEDEDGNRWICPTTGTITAGYPNYPASFGGGFHGGIDIANKEGTPILASGNGTVAVVDNYLGDKDEQPYGNLIIINQNGDKTGNMYKMYYAHLSTISVKEGDTVMKGQQIGTMGSTGNSTGSHLHYEMRHTPFTPQKATVMNPAVNLTIDETIS